MEYVKPEVEIIELEDADIMTDDYIPIPSGNDNTPVIG